LVRSSGVPTTLSIDALLLRGTEDRGSGVARGGGNGIDRWGAIDDMDALFIGVTTDRGSVRGITRFGSSNITKDVECDDDDDDDDDVFESSVCRDEVVHDVTSFCRCFGSIVVVKEEEEEENNPVVPLTLLRRLESVSSSSLLSSYSVTYRACSCCSSS
jgi:hypothetical protein